MTGMGAFTIFMKLSSWGKAWNDFVTDVVNKNPLVPYFFGEPKGETSSNSKEVSASEHWWSTSGIGKTLSKADIVGWLWDKVQGFADGGKPQKGSLFQEKQKELETLVVEPK